MIFTNRALISFGCRTCHLVRFSSISTHYEGLTINPKFTKEEQRKVLDTLNTSNSEQLTRFDVSLGRIKNLESWKNKKGPFQSLADVLEVDGLGVKILERLCESIITDKPQAVNNKTSNGSKNRRQFLTPTLSNEKASTLSSAVALHLRPAGISWAKLSRDGNFLDAWHFIDFSVYPKKMLPTDTFKLAMTILNKIPIGEAYVFEASPAISPQQGNQQSIMMTSYNQQQELTSMLLALINTSPNHTMIQSDDVNNFTNSVYHLRANLPARLFRTLMGSERVSSTTTVKMLLDSARKVAKCTLPCTPISITNQLEEEYLSQIPVHRELMGQALLLVITFMDLCVNKNPDSLAAVVPGKR